MYEAYWQHRFERPQLKILRTWINIRANSLINTSVNNMKRKSMKIPGKLSVAQKSEPARRRKLHQNRYSWLIFMRFFFSRTELVSKRAKKLYFTHYLCMVITLFNASLNKSAISKCSFGKLGFPLCLISVVLYLFCMLNFDVILIRLYNIM